MNLATKRIFCGLGNTFFADQSRCPHYPKLRAFVSSTVPADYILFSQRKQRCGIPDTLTREKSTDKLTNLEQRGPAVRGFMLSMVMWDIE